MKERVLSCVTIFNNERQKSDRKKESCVTIVNNVSNEVIDLNRDPSEFERSGPLKVFKLQVDLASRRQWIEQRLVIQVTGVKKVKAAKNKKYILTKPYLTYPNLNFSNFS